MSPIPRVARVPLTTKQPDVCPHLREKLAKLKEEMGKLAAHEKRMLASPVTLPKPMTSGAKSEGRFGKQDFAYLPEEDAYRCPAGERLPYRYTNEEDGKMLRRYWTTACQNCSLKSQCTTGPERRITRWEHEHLLEAVQQRLDSNPQ